MTQPDKNVCEAAGTRFAGLFQESLSCMTRFSATRSAFRCLGKQPANHQSEPDRGTDDRSEIGNHARWCPACSRKLFTRWPWGWDGHAAHACTGVVGATPDERRRIYRERYVGQIIASDEPARRRAAITEREAATLPRSFRSDGTRTQTAHPCRAASHGARHNAGRSLEHRSSAAGIVAAGRFPSFPG